MQRDETGMPRSGTDVVLGNMLAEIQQELRVRYGQTQHVRIHGLFEPEEPDVVPPVSPREHLSMDKGGCNKKLLKRGRECDPRNDAADALPPSSPSGRCLATGCRVKRSAGTCSQTSRKRLRPTSRVARMEDNALVHLTQDDWECALHPMAELRPYLISTSAASSPMIHGDQPPTPAGTGSQPATEGSDLQQTRIDRGDAGARPEKHCAAPSDGLTSSPYDSEAVVNYIKCRCAELPMRLRLEALQMRRHEHLHRQHMQELIRLSEFLTLCGAVPSGATCESSTGGPPGPNHSGTSKAPLYQYTKPSPPQPGHGDVPKKDGVEGLQLLSRCFQRVAELERLVSLDSMNKVLCAERMVLLSSTTLAAARRLDPNI